LEGATKSGTIYEDEWEEVNDGDNGEEEINWVNNMGNIEEVEEFLIDSGTTCHVTYKDNDLDNRAPSKSIVCMGDETKAEIEATGDLSLRVCNTDVVVSLSLIHYVPRFKKHIISVSRLCRDGYEITITGQECRIKTMEGAYIVIKKSKDGMFYLDVLRNQKKLIMSTMAIEKPEIVHIIPMEDEDAKMEIPVQDPAQAGEESKVPGELYQEV